MLCHTLTTAGLSSARLARATILTTLLLSAATPAPAQVLLDTFGPNEAFHPSIQGLFISGGADNFLAVQFTPATTSGIAGIAAALQSTGGNGVSSLIITIYPDNAGEPGTVAAWTSSPLLVATTSAVYTFTSPDPGTLTSGQPYWLVFSGSGTLTSGNAAGAHPGDPAVLGTRAHRFGPGPWTVSTSVVLPAVRIDGQLIGACCNRFNGACLITVEATCTGLGLRYDGHGSACSPESCNACPADFNGTGTVTVQDLFDYLAAWFARCP